MGQQDVPIDLFIEGCMRMKGNALQWREERLFEHKEFFLLCECIDENRSGSITWDEFEDHIKEPIVIAYFHAMDLRIKDAETFFKTISEMMGQQDVPIDLFIEGCMRMKGNASSMDLYVLSAQVRHMHEGLRRLNQHLGLPTGYHAKGRDR